MSQFSFCASHSIPHFCDLLPFLRLACSDTHIFRSGCLQRQHSQVWSLSPGLGLLCPHHPHHPQGPLSWGKAQSLLYLWRTPDSRHSLLRDPLSGVFQALLFLLCRHWNGSLCGIYRGHPHAEPLYLQPEEQGHEGGFVQILRLGKNSTQSKGLSQTRSSGSVTGLPPYFFIVTLKTSNSKQDGSQHPKLVLKRDNA